MVSPLVAARMAGKAAHNVAGKRFLSDITITRTGKPILRTEGGRYVSSRTPIATIY
jgi:NADH dehydrogenase (ubiquinone) 1 alpha subcomplex subunit 9